MRYASSNAGTFSHSPYLKIGILRENYDKWERRVPLCPEHVQDFLARHPNCQVLVQPSPNRVFSTQDYERVGAKVQDDLSDADLILGVKRPKTMENLPSNKTYMFFGHVIKGQTENMPLLQECLDKKIQLIDYECILDVPANGGKAKRSIAFGKYAGYAGMIDTFPALGRRLLMKDNLSTPFLNCPPTIHHYDLDEAKKSVARMADRLATEGLPHDMEPLVFTMTGKGGNVYNGVREIFDILPHEIVSVADLPEVSQVRGPQYKVFGVVPEKHEILQRESDGHAAFERTDYYQNPNKYKSVFAEKVAPWSNVIVNCAYWDYRYPRLLTKDDIQNLYMNGNERLMLVSDISCDPGGSIEFFARSTTIDRPCYQYDPIQGREVSDHIDSIGVTMLGVDILPTELPADSSRHFGNVLSCILDEFVAVKAASQSPSDLMERTRFPPRLQKATITSTSGELTEPFRYLESILKMRSTQNNSTKPSKHMMLLLEGHLFDSGLINHALDLIEQHGCFFEFKECFVPRRPNDGTPVKSSAVLKVTGGMDVDFLALARKVHDLVTAIQAADATLKVFDENNRHAYVRDPEEKTVLVLGSGLVSKSVVDLLGRSKDRLIIVASDDDDDARKIARVARRGRHFCVDVKNDQKHLTDLVKRADAVISLLPAPMHPAIAELCIKHHKNLITASYESDQIRRLGQAAEDAGIIILNEVGLDPGLDHMSAMKLIDDIHDRGGVVTSFRSVCGGLPAPDAANNPLKYKFSWSPRGVITASQNAARYRKDNVIVEIDGEHLLQNAAPFTEAWPELQLECLPNRDSILYENIYGIEGVATIFRGTLRYDGFSSLMYVFRNVGLFGPQLFDRDSTWRNILDELQRISGNTANLEEFFVQCAGGDRHLASRAWDCLQLMNMTSHHGRVKHSGQVIDLFCEKLEEYLQYDKGERDMVTMHHSIIAKFEDGSVEEHDCTLLAMGTESMTAMCKTVGYPTAATTDLILRGQLQGRRGLVLPTSRDIYKPTLEMMTKEGIVFQERVRVTMDKQSAAQV